MGKKALLPPLLSFFHLGSLQFGIFSLAWVTPAALNSSPDPSPSPRYSLYPHPRLSTPRFNLFRLVPEKTRENKVNSLGKHETAPLIYSYFVSLLHLVYINNLRGAKLFPCLTPYWTCPYTHVLYPKFFPKSWLIWCFGLLKLPVLLQCKKRGAWWWNLHMITKN